MKKPLQITDGIVFLFLCLVAAMPVQAGSFLVTTNSDGPEPGPPGSLRAAIAAANASPDGFFDISFDPNVTGTIFLTGGELTLQSGSTKIISVIGPGANVLSIVSATSRIFNISLSTTISGLTMTGVTRGADGPNGQCSPLVDGPNINGQEGEGAGGGAILAFSSLTLYNCVFASCDAIGGNGGNGIQCACSGSCILLYDYSGNGGHGGDAAGGAIYAWSDLYVHNCTFSDDHAIGGNGGRGADHFLFSGSVAGHGGSAGDAYGGAIFFSYHAGFGLFRFDNTTVFGNSAAGGVGGDGGNNYTSGSGTGGAGSSSGSASGGGFYQSGLVLEGEPYGIFSCTVNNNNCIAWAGGSGGTGFNPGLSGAPGFAASGGMFLHGTILQNTLVASNYLTGNGTLDNSEDVSGGVDSEGNNLIGVVNGINWDAGPYASDQYGTINNSLDAGVAPALRNNGGTTPTLALRPGSRAIDQGNAHGLTTDQRGFPRPVDFDDTLYPNAVGGDGSDIGAFEVPEQVIWTNVVDGRWEAMTNWLDQILPSVIADVYITNDTFTNAKTILIDSETCLLTDLMTVNSLTIGTPPGSLNNNHLLVSETTFPLHIPDLYILSGGDLQINAAQVIVDRTHTMQVDGSCGVTDGGLIALKAKVGQAAPGVLTLNSGTAQFNDLLVGCGSYGTVSNLAADLNVSNLVIGAATGSTGGFVMSGGTLLLTNGGPLVIGGAGTGGLVLNGGIVTAGAVFLTNGVQSRLQMNGGVLNSTSLLISPGAIVSGNGTIRGPIMNSGSVIADGGPLVITGPVTNNGTLGATNGATLSVYGAVVNNGVINLTSGRAQFLAGLLNLGTVVPPSGSVHTISNLNDNGPGSLRQAIADAAAGDTLVFSVTGLLVLTNGELAIDRDLTIIGPGAANLIIDGHHANRIFDIGTDFDIGHPAVNISGLTLVNGAEGVANGQDSHGAGIRTDGTMMLSGCVIRSCVAGGPVSPSGSYVLGGGIFNNGFLTLMNDTLSGNSAAGEFVTNGDGGIAVGGGVFNGRSLVAINCTFAGNVATGGLSRGGFGGAIYSTGAGSTVSLTNCTVAGNAVSATPSGDAQGGDAQGGGIYILDGSLSLKNNIIARNTTAPGAGTPPGVGGHPDVYVYPFGPTVANAGFNLIGMADSLVVWGPTDRTGSSGSPLDPLLGLLQDNGGPTPTMALTTGSPAIDAGDSTSIVTDQRGLSRPVDIVGIANTSDGSDIGAYELASLMAVPPVLTIVYNPQTESVTISWPSLSIGWGLQVNTSLASANWLTPLETIQDNGTIKFIVVDQPTGNRFYRLKSQ